MKITRANLASTVYIAASSGQLLPGAYFLKIAVENFGGTVEEFSAAAYRACKEVAFSESTFKT